VSVFLILLISLSTRNPLGERNAPNAYSCLSPWAVWAQVGWLGATCARVIWILMFSVYRRAQRLGEERESEELAAQIAAHDLDVAVAAIRETDANAADQIPGQILGQVRERMRRQLRGLSAAELASIPAHIPACRQANAAAGGSLVGAVPLWLAGVVGEKCAVCLEEMCAGQPLKRSPGCRHAFHGGCLDGWLAVKNQCPYCRSFAITRAS
jgi:hypothetical protein